MSHAEIDQSQTNVGAAEASTDPVLVPADGTSSLPASRNRVLDALSFRRISAIYILVALIILFGLWVPDTFLRVDIFRTMLDAQALTAIVAVGLVLPLSAGVFDLAVGASVGAGSILVAWLLTSGGLPVWPSILIAVACGLAIGVVSGFFVVKVRIDSFIATLGMSSILLAAIQWISNSQQILNLPADFQKLGTNELLGITYPTWMMLFLAFVIWYVLERTPTGRKIYATGGNIEAARLTGVRTGTVIVCCLAAGSFMAATAGILTSARIGTGDPTTGPSFLLPAYAAAFLGSTQFKGGRYNVFGTILAVYVLAVGVKGLQLAGAPIWIPDLFNGIALLLAVGLAKTQAGNTRARAIRRVMSKQSADDGHAGRTAH